MAEVAHGVVDARAPRMSSELSGTALPTYTVVSTTLTEVAKDVFATVHTNGLDGARGSSRAQMSRSLPRCGVLLGLIRNA
jgi:hypothetical protein